MNVKSVNVIVWQRYEHFTQCLFERRRALTSLHRARKTVAKCPQNKMILLTKRSFILLILLHSINQSGAGAIGTSQSIVTNRISDENLVSSRSAKLYGGVTRKLIYPLNRNYVYLNYKEAYGIRYDPGANSEGNRFSLPQIEAPNESGADGDMGMMQPPEEPVTPGPPAVPESTEMSGMPDAPGPTGVPEVPEPMPTESAAPETTTECITDPTPTEPGNGSSTSQTAYRKPTIAFSALSHKTSNKWQNNKTQIVRPISSIRETLNLIRRRIKQWFTSGIDLNAPLVNGQRFLNVFNIIRFENSECKSTQEMLEEMIGTCYHDYQCTEMGGTSIGECADGLGVCCICRSTILISLER